MTNNNIEMNIEICNKEHLFYLEEMTRVQIFDTWLHNIKTLYYFTKEKCTICFNDLEYDDDFSTYKFEICYNTPCSKIICFDCVNKLAELQETCHPYFIKCPFCQCNYF